MSLWSQANAGVMCPVSMTYSAIPALRRDPELAAEWEPRLTLPDYERGALCGMAMTEKQGGSDVRANTHARGARRATGTTRSRATSGSARRRCATSSSCSPRCPRA